MDRFVYLIADTTGSYENGTLPLEQMRVWSVVEQTSWHSGDVGGISSGGISSRTVASELALAEAEARAQAEQGAVA